jgi:phosphoribosyl 1,2-cyclic phosphodiesterase
MKIQFWGVRGSIPTPLTPDEVRGKIDAVIERLHPDDLASEDSKKRFIDSLPKWLYGTAGGNTACVEVTTDDEKRIILDLGSGVRVLGKQTALPKNDTFHILLSHFHWDHIQGLPFFDYAYRPDCTLHFYSASEQAEQFLRLQMSGKPFFPVSMDNSFTKNMYFHLTTPGTPFNIGSARIDSKKMKHPGDSYAYAITDGGKKFIYATDVELTTANFERTKDNIDFFEYAQAIVIDAQYLVGEALAKENWGHSPFCYAIDFADFWKIESLYLFHHEPVYDDERIHSILESAKWYSDTVSRHHVKVFEATEDLTVNI